MRPEVWSRHFEIQFGAVSDIIPQLRRRDDLFYVQLVLDYPEIFVQPAEVAILFDPNQ